MSNQEVKKGETIEELEAENAALTEEAREKADVLARRMMGKNVETPEIKGEHPNSSEVLRILGIENKPGLTYDDFMEALADYEKRVLVDKQNGVGNEDDSAVIDSFTRWTDKFSDEDVAKKIEDLLNIQRSEVVPQDFPEEHTSAYIQPESVGRIEPKWQKDYYTMMGISPEASAEEIQEAFERIRADYRGRNEASLSLNEWVEIQKGKDVLLDPSRRVEYDASLKAKGSNGSEAKKESDTKLAEPRSKQPSVSLRQYNQEQGEVERLRWEREGKIKKSKPKKDSLGQQAPREFGEGILDAQQENLEKNEKKEIAGPKPIKLAEKLSEADSTELERLKTHLEGEKVYRFIENEKGEKEMQYLQLKDISFKEVNGVEQWVADLVIYDDKGNQLADLGKKDYKIGNTTYREYKKLKGGEVKEKEEILYRNSRGKNAGEFSNVKVEEIKDGEYKIKDSNNKEKSFKQDDLGIYKDEDGNKAIIERQKRRPVPAKEGKKPKPGKPGVEPEIEVGVEVKETPKKVKIDEASLELIKRKLKEKIKEKVAEKRTEAKTRRELEMAMREAERVYGEPLPEAGPVKENLILPKKEERWGKLKRFMGTVESGGEKEAIKQTWEGIPAALKEMHRGFPVSLVWRWLPGRAWAWIRGTSEENAKKIEELRQGCKDFWSEAGKEATDWWEENAWSWLTSEKKNRTEEPKDDIESPLEDVGRSSDRIDSMKDIELREARRRATADLEKKKEKTPVSGEALRLTEIEELKMSFALCPKCGLRILLEMIEAGVCPFCREDIGGKVTDPKTLNDLARLKKLKEQEGEGAGGGK